MELPVLKFGLWDDEPIAWTPGLALVFRDGAWVPANSSVVGLEARLMFLQPVAGHFHRRPASPAPIT
jgi:hypothetical protein